MCRISNSIDAISFFNSSEDCQKLKDIKIQDKAKQETSKIKDLIIMLKTNLWNWDQAEIGTLVGY